MGERWTDDRDYQDYANELVERAPESWDDDVAQEAITLDYLRHLEAEVERLGGCRHPSCRWDFGEPCDHGYLATEVSAPIKKGAQRPRHDFGELRLRLADIRSQLRRSLREAETQIARVERVLDELESEPVYVDAEGVEGHAVLEGRVVELEEQPWLPSLLEHSAVCTVPPSGVCAECREFTQRYLADAEPLYRVKPLTQGEHVADA